MVSTSTSATTTTTTSAPATTTIPITTVTATITSAAAAVAVPCIQQHSSSSSSSRTNSSTTLCLRLRLQPFRRPLRLSCSLLRLACRPPHCRRMTTKTAARRSSSDPSQRPAAMDLTRPPRPPILLPGSALRQHCRRSPSRLRQLRYLCWHRRCRPRRRRLCRCRTPPRRPAGLDQPSRTCSRRLSTRHTCTRCRWRQQRRSRQRQRRRRLQQPLLSPRCTSRF